MRCVCFCKQTLRRSIAVSFCTAIWRVCVFFFSIVFNLLDYFVPLSRSTWDSCQRRRRRGKLPVRVSRFNALVFSLSLSPIGSGNNNFTNNTRIEVHWTFFLFNPQLFDSIAVVFAQCLWAYSRRESQFIDCWSYLAVAVLGSLFWVNSMVESWEFLIFNRRRLSICIRIV